MRTALRTSIVTAALAGALLAPAATAIAAPAQAATSVSAVSASGTGNDRYDGEAVPVADGRIAVLRNKSEGPEAWIRAVSPDWKPGDSWAGRVLAKLDTTHKRAVIEGVQYDLKKIEDGPDKDRYVLNVYVLGEGALRCWYLLPKAEPVAKPSTKPAVKPSAKPAVKPATVPAAKPAAAPAAKPQTAVVPKGPVAAGAEVSESTHTAVADTDNTTTAATGAALIAILAGLGATFAVRGRKARARG
ncbi:hypothetical protein [Streptomyces sp. NPDC002082]|uniref:hypothetical protein n=1 Tax=Streptomyces sp. NPDC002082 TaxID=3154772 RepID=UPI00332EB71B